MFKSSITKFLIASLAALMTGLFVTALILAVQAWTNHALAGRIAHHQVLTGHPRPRRDPEGGRDIGRRLEPDELEIGGRGIVSAPGERQRAAHGIVADDRSEARLFDGKSHIRRPVDVDLLGPRHRLAR